MLELKNISKKFKDRQILSDFNLTVEENKNFSDSWSFWWWENNPIKNVSWS